MTHLAVTRHCTRAIIWSLFRNCRSHSNIIWRIRNLLLFLREISNVLNLIFKLLQISLEINCTYVYKFIIFLKNLMALSFFMSWFLLIVLINFDRVFNLKFWIAGLAILGDCLWGVILLYIFCLICLSGLRNNLMILVWRYLIMLHSF